MPENLNADVSVRENAIFERMLILVSTNITYLSFGYQNAQAPYSSL
jgi:hypothetical protein